MTSEEFSRFFLNKRCFWKVQRLLWRSIFSWKSFRLTMPKPHRSLFFFSQKTPIPVSSQATQISQTVLISSSANTVCGKHEQRQQTHNKPHCSAAGEDLQAACTHQSSCIVPRCVSLMSLLGKIGQGVQSSAAASQRPFMFLRQSNLKGGKTTALYILHYSRKMVNEAPKP